MRVLLISTYELGRQPFGLASPAAWLRRAGAQVTCCDLAIDHLGDPAIQSADLAAIYVPMHTATRLAIPLARRIKQVNPRAHLCFYGLYAPANERFLRSIGVDSIIGGEFENGLVALYERLRLVDSFTFSGSGRSSPLDPDSTSISLARQDFILPDRSDLPAPAKYARLDWGGESRTTGYTEASRGCKHLCRHCPIVPIYGGQFRVVAKEIVLADIRQQVARGVRHITFGDPDFFNGIGHAIPIARALHQEHPDVTYDVTIKIEHLLKHRELIPVLRDTGCAFVTSAVEAVDDRILDIFDKHHTREDFVQTAEMFATLGMVLQPTFVAFNPWISLPGYRDLLALIAQLGLIENVPSIQYAIRLLVPSGSRLLELPDSQEWLGAFDAEKLCYTWMHRDARVDLLQNKILGIVQESAEPKRFRRDIFERVWKAAEEMLPVGERRGMTSNSLVSKPIPHLSEPWYC